MNIDQVLNPLQELFSVKNDRVEFDPENQYTSYMKKTTTSDFNKVYTLQGNVVYSIADMRYNPDTRDMLYKLKNGIKDEDVHAFLNHIIEDIDFLVKELGIEFIIQVPSSSKFLQKVSSEISQRVNIPQASFVSIQKIPLSELKFNKRSPQLENMDRDDIAEIKQQVIKHIQYQLKDGNEYLEAKRFPKNLLGFITGFFKVSGNPEQLKGKKVLIIDDNLSSGNTMKDIVDMFSIQYQSQASGLVLFSLKLDATS